MDSTATAHDTGIIEVGNYNSFTLRLTRTPAQKHLIDRTTVKTVHPRAFMLILIPAIPGAILIVVSLCLSLPLTLATINVPLPFVNTIALIGGILLAIALLTLIVISYLEFRQDKAIKALEGSAGVSEPLRLWFKDGLHDSSVEVRKEIADNAMQGLTPEVRDSLFSLLDEGQAEAVSEALNILMDESVDQWAREKRRRRTAAKGEQSSLALRALKRAER